VRPNETPIGFLLTQTSKKLARAFDDELAQAGGSLPLWLILLSLMREGPCSHAELASHVGVRGPTLTHHLDALESRGIITRERLQDNRRTQIAKLTDEGIALFHRLRKTAQSFDARLRRGFSEKELADLRRLLQKIGKNVLDKAKF
jgi:MarR family transcriptional regulator for hemolysin